MHHLPFGTVHGEGADVTIAYLSALALLRLHVLAQQLVEPGLISGSLLLEPGKNIRIQAYGNRLLGWNSQFGFTEKVFSQFGDIRGVEKNYSMKRKLPKQAPGEAPLRLQTGAEGDRGTSTPGL